MDLRDYLRMLRRGSPAIVIAMVLGGLLATLYLQATPKVYQATAALLVAPSNPQSIGELQIGSQYAQSAAPTIATLIGTAAVLRPAARDLEADGVGGSLTAETLQGLVGASSPEGSAIVYVTSSTGDPELASAVANTVAQRAVAEVPGVVSSQRSTKAPLLEVQVLQRAQTPAGPSAPNEKRIFVLFVAVGLALGLAVALLRQSLDRRLRRSEDLAEVTRVPLLATLARGLRGGRGGRLGIVVRDSPTSSSVEGYRVLRTNLGALGNGRRSSVLVTAVSQDSSAVQVPVNLAWSFAQTGRRVLLVDLDLRRSSVAELFDIAGRPGAADVLTGRVPLRDAIAPTTMPNLHVVPGGVANQAPSDLLSGRVLDTMMSTAEADYDVVVVHAPPLLSYTDAAVVARASGHTVVLVHAGRTQAPDLSRALSVLANVGVSPLGLVLSDARVSVADNLRARGTQTQTSPAALAVAGTRRGPGAVE